MSTLKKLKGASSLHDLAAILGYKPSALSFIVYKIPTINKYTKFTIPKSGGGEREICAPIEPLKTLQRHLANVLYACSHEIDSESGRRPLSHGFRRGLSIITNARRHKRRRYVLNLDLQDFFPTFNFGRVRGFFIHNNSFKLHEKVATIVAQVACFENKLPQGSPCSPIIADLIAHLLDVRLAQLAKQNQLTYSRYADDLTFSTSQLAFPSTIAAPEASGGPEWLLGNDLAKAIQSAGFVTNPAKTRMQFRMSRQLVTGLTVNAKVNVRPEYYRWARAMCHSLFETGAYHRPAAIGALNDDAAAEKLDPELITSLWPLEGILSHIHHVKDTIDGRIEPEKRKDASAARKLYARFLKYRYFVCLERPLVVCEGKTDNIYLKYAIRNLTGFHPKLGSWNGAVFTSAVTFFNYANQAHSVLELGGGASELRYFFIKNRYKHDIHHFKHRPLKQPVIVLIDNDNGASDIFSTIKKNYGFSVDITSSDPFFHITDNLYLVKTPATAAGVASCIEDFFDPSLLKTELGGKKFNPKKDSGADSEYGKFVFAEKIVRPNAEKIDFTGFTPLLDRLVDRIQHLVPAPDGGDDFIGVGGPGEGRGLPIVLFEESIDGGLQIDDRSEYAALESALGERGEEAFDGVEPRAGRRREVEDEPLVPSEPLEHFGMLVGGVIVEDHMHHLAGGNPSVDGVEKADELLMAVALHVLADDRAVENIHGGEQRRRAVPDVVVGHRAGAALLERQPGLGAVERLNLALLVERQDDGVRGRIDIEPDHIAQLLDEFRIVGKFELPHAVRLKTMFAPDALNRADGDARGLRHQSAGPMRCLPRRRIERQGHDPRNDLVRQQLDARRPRLVARQPLEPFVGEPFLPAPDTSFRLARPAHDLVRAHAVGRQKHDLAPPNVLLRRVAILDQSQKPEPIFRRNGKRYSRAHAPDSHIASPPGILNRIQMSDFIH